MITIKKAKITKENTLEVSYTEGSNEITLKCKNEVHKDMREAFKALIPHLAILCDLKEAYKFMATEEARKQFADSLDIKIMPEEKDLFQLHSLSVQGFAIGGDAEFEGLVLTGQKKIGKKVLCLNTPFTKWSDEYEPYKFITQLSKAIDLCIDEIKLYLGGKANPPVQQKLELEPEQL